MRRKIDPIILEKLLRDGLSQREIAEEMRASEGAISKNIKFLNLAKAKDVVLRSAKKLHTRDLNAMDRLGRICSVVEGELNRILTELKTVKKEKRIPWLEIELKHCSEIRKQVSLIRDIQESFYRIEQIVEFQHLVIDTVKEVAPEAWNEIRKRVEQRHSNSTIPGLGRFGV
jgi:predicted DNA-binding protein YlxM (UPF0122 family)